MIGSLRGLVIDREAVLDRSATAELTIEVAGVGYRVTATAATLSRLPPDEPVLLFVHHHITEANQKLFGFLAKEERAAFEGLLSAHGVGPALALAVLATHPVDQLARILADDDLGALCEVPGVGKKTAQRLLVELKSTLVLPVLDGADGGPIDLNGSAAGAGLGPVRPLVDVREALVNLGYSSEEIRRAVAGLSEQNTDTADTGQLLKLALLNLANG
ncbi:MAG: Holliday junction branch migration protein RuvA [Acidimicrobiales bacterium]